MAVPRSRCDVPGGDLSDAAERIYARALELPPNARAALLAEACPDDGLRAELMSLLEHAEPAQRFFERLQGLVATSDVAAPGSDRDQRGIAERECERNAFTRPDPPIGGTIGHYRILSHIGSGGMGTVYRAHDARLNRDVALKFLPPHLHAQRDAAERLLVEARAAASLQHPNVCVVHDIGETEDGRPFIAMALCEGETLKERLRRGAMELGAVVSTAAQIARGLAAAHGRGIVHRDVKPANVMIAGDGTVKLLDFGLAKVSDASITRPGVTPGTMAYMSPEQVRGDPVDHRTDLWSLGVVLHEMLTGARPFRGGSDRALAQSILHDDPPSVSRHASEVPDALARIVTRLLRKTPDARYGSSGELLTDLAGVLAARPGPLPPNEASRVDAVFSYGILDLSPEPTYDELTELAARICGVPVAYIKFFDDTRAWFASKVGLPPELASVPREASVCNSTICQTDLVVIPDCSVDERFRDNPTVTGWPNVRFYCGMPLIDAEGYALGTFCIFDYAARELSFEHQELIRTLARQVVRQLELRRLTIRLGRSLAALERAHRDTEREQATSRALLHDLLPRDVVEELRATGHVRARHHPLVTVLFGDFHDFTRFAASMEPARLIRRLDEFFSAFDAIVERHGLQRIKTLGDWYVCAGGVPVPSPSHTVEACYAALAMQAETARINQVRAAEGLDPWELRIGIHAGSAMTGGIGRRKTGYDIWGDVVKVAQRVEAAGAPGRIAISGPVYQRVHHVFDAEPWETIEVRNRGPVSTYLLTAADRSPSPA